jgi:hypothetical protein
MNSRLILKSFTRSAGLTLATLVLAAAASVFAAETKVPAPVGTAVSAAPVPPVVPVTPAVTAPAALSFDSFRIVTQRNIFNPNRIGLSRDSDGPAPRMDEITLVGSMDSQKGLYAFFDSQDNTYRKALHEGGAIAQFTVQHIASDAVDLSRDGKITTMKIGQQLRRPIGGEWSVTTPEPPSIAPPADVITGSSSTATTPGKPGDAQNEVLRKMLEQRQKQLKQ